MSAIPEPPQQAEGREAGLGLSFALDETGRKLVASYSPAVGAAPIDIGWLERRLDGLGLSFLPLDENAVAELLRRYNAGDEAFALEIGEARDGEASLEISPDKMEAFLTLTPPQGGKPVTREQAAQLLQSKGVSFGILGEEVERAVAAEEVKRRLVAAGQPPVNGENGRLETLVSLAVRHAPSADEHGRVDYRELGGIVTVREGERLMRRVPPTLGLAGQNVLGQVIPAKPGQEVMFAARLEGAQQDPDDPDYLIATMAGRPVPAEGGMNVEPTITIENVDLSLGNVNFDGSINIKGSVQMGMVVRATGDIEIGGMVEAATLDAGGNIIIKGGVIGHVAGADHSPEEHVGEVRIRCDGSLSARFIENAVVEAGDSILVEELVLQSELAAGNLVAVGKGAGKGRIIGGEVQAGKEVQAGVIGSPADVKTRIAVGVNPRLNDRLHQTVREQEKLVREREDVDKLLRFSELNPGKIKEETLGRVHHTREVLEQKAIFLQQELEDIQAQISLAEEARVLIGKILHSNVFVYFGEKYYQATDDLGPGAFFLREGEIVFE